MEIHIHSDVQKSLLTSYIKLSVTLQVKDSQTTENLTRLRINAATFGIRGTEEKLGQLYSFCFDKLLLLIF